MKKKIKILSAIILVVSLTSTIFTACKLNDKNDTEETAGTSIVHGTDYTYSPIENPKESKTEYVFTAPPIPTEKETKKLTTVTNESATVSEEKSTARKPTGGKVEEIANGITLITKTSPVSKNNAATIVVLGTPGKSYSIEFYKNNTQKASSDGLGNTISDSSGYATWTFLIEEDCEPGERKVIIKEKNSDKYIQTSITIQ